MVIVELRMEHSVIQSKEETSNLTIPVHVAIIMDGNGRWAEERGLPRIQGHRAGVDNLQRVIRAFGQYGVSYLTLYAFSTENWRRPEEEVDGLMNLLKDAIRREARSLHQQNCRLRHIGRLDRISPDLRNAIHEALDLTKENTGLNLGIAFDYGGREELLLAIQRLVEEGTHPDQISEELLRQHLYTKDLPDPDLIIRTAGEERLSNFLLWQSAYSELYFTSGYWPDFNEEEVTKALVAFSQRRRRFGAL